MSRLTFMHLATHGGRNIGNAALVFGLEFDVGTAVGAFVADRFIPPSTV